MNNGLLTILHRKSATTYLRVVRHVLVMLRVAYAKALNPGAEIPWSTRIGRGVVIRATDGGTLKLQKHVHLGANSLVVVQGGRLAIGERVFIGPGCTVVAKKLITIGTSTLIAEHVTIRDHDHRIDLLGPISETGFQCNPIAIADGVWLGAKSSVLRGSRIGPGAVVGAHSLVRGDIPANAVAVGVPARVIRVRGQPR
ncbi:acyltransferase [Luteimonas sp. MC1825]|nr:acyltransferase [Luteimonas sp. MC1825]QOC89180.1 acyltransferase [Luteimonas sp. MC1825]